MKIRAEDTRKKIARIVVAVIAAIGLSACGKGGTPAGAPEYGAAGIEISGKDLVIRYDGRKMFEAEVAAGETGVEAKVNVTRAGEAGTQTVLLTPRGPRARIRRR